MNASSDIDTSMALEKMAINPKIIHDDVNSSHLHFEKEIYQATEHLNEVNHKLPDCYAKMILFKRLLTSRRPYDRFANFN